MKSKNLDLLLLQYNQTHKELVANEWFATIDALAFRQVTDFIEILPNKPGNKLYIISKNSQGELSRYIGSLAFYVNGWRYLSPKDGFILYVRTHSRYFLFEEGKWRMMGKSTTKLQLVGGEIKLCLEKNKIFEIITESDARVSFINYSKATENIEIKFFTNKKVNLTWGEEMVFSQGVIADKVGQGGMKLTCYYSELHKKNYY